MTLRHYHHMRSVKRSDIGSVRDGAADICAGSLLHFCGLPPRCCFPISSSHPPFDKEKVVGDSLQSSIRKEAIPNAYRHNRSEKEREACTHLEFLTTRRAGEMERRSAGESSHPRPAKRPPPSSQPHKHRRTHTQPARRSNTKHLHRRHARTVARSPKTKPSYIRRHKKTQIACAPSTQGGLAAASPPANPRAPSKGCRRRHPLQPAAPAAQNLRLAPPAALLRSSIPGAVPPAVLSNAGCCSSASNSCVPRSALVSGRWPLAASFA
jgi:hypothetical protein